MMNRALHTYLLFRSEAYVYGVVVYACNDVDVDGDDDLYVYVDVDIDGVGSVDVDVVL